MKRSTKFFGKKYYTIEDSIFSFLFRDIFIIGFPRSPYFIYVMKPLLLLVQKSKGTFPFLTPTPKSRIWRKRD